MQVAVALPLAQYPSQCQSHVISPPPIASTSTQIFYNAARTGLNTRDSEMSGAPPALPDGKTDPMYAHLPTYRFPAGPSRSGSAPVAKATGLGSQLFARNRPALPVAPPADQLYDERSHNSSATSPVPSLQASSSTGSSSASQALLKPALPIIAFPNAPLPEFETENVYPSGLVSQAEPSYSPLPASHGYHGYHAAPIAEGVPWNSLSPTKVAPSSQQLMPQTPSRFSDYHSPQHFDMAYSPADVSPTTYLPSSAYLPSSGTFVGPPLSTVNIPRSAPSTPLGRQDARFLGKTGWPPQALPNPFPLNAPQTEPRMRTDFGASFPPSNAQPALAQSTSGYYSADDFERDTSPLYMSIDSSRSADITDPRYIPYARSTKLSASQSKRSPPSALETTASKRAKRTLEDLGASRESPSYSPGLGEIGTKPKQQRCKIACAACRKTRLKCDGGSPCTSCIEKQLKADPSQSEAEAQAHIQTTGTCVYENFVRRRGKGKKTLEKERHDHGSAGEQASRSGSSEHPNDVQMPLQHHGLDIESLSFRHFNRVENS